MSAACRVEIVRGGRWKISWPDGVRWNKITLGTDFIDSYRPDHDNPQVKFKDGQCIREARFPESVSATILMLQMGRDTWEKY